MTNLILASTHNPVCAIYLLVSATYAWAAVLARRHGHREYVKCYAANAVLHGVIAAFHVLGMA